MTAVTEYDRKEWLHRTLDIGHWSCPFCRAHTLHPTPQWVVENWGGEQSDVDWAA